MAQVYSTTFWEQAGLSGPTPALTPPAGTLWIIRGLDAVISGLTLGNVQLIGGAGQAVWTDSSVALAPSYLSYRGRYVVNFGVQVFITTTAAMDVSLWGYQLTTP